MQNRKGKTCGKVGASVKVSLVHQNFRSAVRDVRVLKRVADVIVLALLYGKLVR